MGNADRCLNLLNIPQENVQGYMSLEAFERRNPNWPTQGKVEFLDVSLKYRPTTDVVLSNLTFRVEALQKIAVVGRPGAGKSTICLSFSRLVDTIEGQILIDDVDIKSVQIEHLRSRISVIPQDPTIFSGTLRFNLDPEEKASDQRLMDILRVA